MRRHLGIVISVAAFLVLSGLTVWAWFEFQPHVPAPANQITAQPNNGYQAGGAQCGPRALAAITDEAERQLKAEACAQAQEDYRLNKDDLVQQTRAANAGAIMADLARDQTRIAVLQSLLTAWGTLLIVGALVVSVADLRQGREANRDAIRAYVYAKSATVNWGENGVRIVISVANDGETPARWFSITGTAEIRPIGSGDPPIFKGGKPSVWSALGSKDERTAPYVVQGVFDRELSGTQENYLSATGIIRYETIFGEVKVSEFTFMQFWRREDRKTMSKNTGVLRVFADEK
jgi:hypothetical protein